MEAMNTSLVKSTVMAVSVTACITASSWATTSWNLPQIAAFSPPLSHYGANSILRQNIHPALIINKKRENMHRLAEMMHDTIGSTSLDSPIEHLEEIDSIPLDDALKQQEETTTYGSSHKDAAKKAAEAKESNISGLDQFVQDMKSLYVDLEHGGGSFRKVISDGIAFTYVAPAGNMDVTDNDNQEGKAEGDRQLFGAWRNQTLEVVKQGEKWQDLHSEITAERISYRLPAINDTSPSSPPPPLAIYLPGLDGLGISATAQYDDLSNAFEFWRMTLPKNGPQPTFARLVTSVVQFVQDATATASANDTTYSQPRDVLIIGESFGGLLACAVAMALSKKNSPNWRLQGMTLVNPATSFEESNWEQLVPPLTSLRYLESDTASNSLAFDLPTPYSLLGSMALALTIPDSQQYSNILQFLLRNIAAGNASLSSATDGLRILAEYLPAATLQHRVTQWLAVGSSVVTKHPARLQQLQVPTLILVGSDDNMLPSKEEAVRLKQIIPNCETLNINGAGHFVLDGRVNITQAIVKSHIDPLYIIKNNSNDNNERYDPILDWKLPSSDTIHKVIEARVKPLRQLTSPVFFSTDTNGIRHRGLSRLPSPQDDNGNHRPILIVGYHQFLGQDLALIIAETLEQRGLVPRGLAHPILWSQRNSTNAPTGTSVNTNTNTNVNSNTNALPPTDLQFDENNPLDNGNLFESFGAVKVSPRNFYRLLQTNQTTLLYPGGVREVFHGKNEAYQLFWPQEQVDFVRIASKFNATIVPLTSIGAPDSVNILIDAPDLLRLPFGLGERLANNSASTIAARFDAKKEDELFLPPLAVPKPLPARHYFVFGTPFDTSGIDPKNKEECEEMYRNIQKEMNRGFDDLLRARQSDPYAFQNVRRVSYEVLWGKSPPTFPVDLLNES